MDQEQAQANAESPSNEWDAYSDELNRLAHESATRGDYGIAAVGVLRGAGRELAIFGWNTMFSEGDPMGHAECNVIRSISEMLSPNQASQGRSRSPVVRVSPNPSATHFEFIVISTLEPCPMCTVAMINAGVTKVVYALADEDAGALGPSNVERLPPIFRDLAVNHLLVEQIESDKPEGVQSYLKRLLGRLGSILQSNRSRLNDTLKSESVLGRQKLLDLIQSSEVASEN
jgi:tRNA(Arg) A34 adenosine deaminase TadA